MCKTRDAWISGVSSGSATGDNLLGIKKRPLRPPVGQKGVHLERFGAFTRAYWIVDYTLRKPSQSVKQKIRDSQFITFCWERTL